MVRDGTMVPARRDDIVFRRIDDDAVLIPMSRSLSEAEALYTLTDVGTRIWELIDGSRTVDDIASVITSEYDVTHEVALGDAIEFVEQLLENGCISSLSAVRE